MAGWGQKEQQGRYYKQAIIVTLNDSTTSGRERL